LIIALVTQSDEKNWLQLLCWCGFVFFWTLVFQKMRVLFLFLLIAMLFSFYKRRGLKGAVQQ